MEKIEQTVDSTLPDVSALTAFEIQFANAYIDNHCNGTRAFLSVKPDADYDYAKKEACMVLKRPHLQRYLEEYKRNLCENGSKLTKDSLITYASYGLERAKMTDEIATMFKGIEVAGKLIGAYDADVDDIAKYTGLISKIQANNVQININTSSSKNE